MSAKVLVRLAFVAILASAIHGESQALQDPAPCAAGISSGPDDPPMTGVLVDWGYSYNHNAWVGVYRLANGRLIGVRCDTYQQIW